MAHHRYPDDRLTGPRDDLAAVERLRAIMHRLRAPGGCPWDAEQTHQSLLPNLLEEAYEVADTIRRGDMAHLREELGDLLLQVVFHSELAEEAGQFTLDDVAHDIADKLVRRHPHVFADAAAGTADAVLRQWDKIKRAEKGHETHPFLHGVGDGLPAVMRAAKLQKKASKVGFDWPDAAAVLAKVREEIAEVEAEYASATPDRARLADEIGDVLFSVVNVARKEGFDPEALVAAANAKFTGRFAAMERLLTASGLTLEAASLDQMEAAWQAAKTL